MRLMLPSWLGSDVALEEAARDNRLPVLREMMQGWPFFRTYVDMLEMVLAKADLRIASYYEQTLLDDDRLKALGESLRTRLQGCIERLLELKEQTDLLEAEPVFAHSMRVRNPTRIHCITCRLNCCGGIGKVRARARCRNWWNGP